MSDELENRPEVIILALAERPSPSPELDFDSCVAWRQAPGGMNQIVSANMAQSVVYLPLPPD